MVSIDELKEQVTNLNSIKMVRTLVVIYLISDSLEVFLFHFTQLIYFPTSTIRHLDYFETVSYSITLIIGLYIAYKIITKSEADYTRYIGMILSFRAFIMIPGLYQAYLNVIASQANPRLKETLFYITRYFAVEFLKLLSGIKMWKKQLDKTLLVLLSSALFVRITMVQIWALTSVRFGDERSLLTVIELSETGSLIVFVVVLLAITYNGKVGRLEFDSNRVVKWTARGILLVGINKLGIWGWRYVIDYSDFLDRAAQFSYNNYFYFYRFILPGLRGVKAVSIIFAALIIYQAKDMSKKHV